MTSDERNPWSIRGVSREARAKAAKAARRRHMTMGEWVEYVLTTSANAELSSRPPAGGPAPEEGPGPEASATGGLALGVEGLERRLVAVEDREKELLALVGRVAAKVPGEAAEVAAGRELARLRSLGEVVHGLVGRIEAYLRPLEKVAGLLRRVEDGERRQRQTLLLLERLVEQELGRKREIDALAQAVARIEKRLDGREREDAAPQPWTPPAVAAPATGPATAPRYDFTALQERAIANSRRFGQREPGERRGIFGRRRPGN
jgi:hypothetical protein